MGLLANFFGRKKYTKTELPTPSDDDGGNTCDINFSIARDLALSIIGCKELRKLPDVLASHNTSMTTVKDALKILLIGLASDVILHKQAMEVLAKYREDVFAVTETDEQGITRTAYYYKTDPSQSIQMAIDFLSWDAATVQMLADKYQVSRTTASNRLKTLKDTEPLLYRKVQERLDTNKKALTSRKKESCE